MTVQRFFIIDSHSTDTTIETAKNTKPDMIEIMPGIATKVISKLKETITVPIIAGGLIETKAEVETAVKCGATAVSTSNVKLWANM